MTYNKEDKMSSKKALRYLLENSEELFTQYEEDKKFYLDAVELYNIVLKDLEKLEKIKEIITLEESYVKTYSRYDRESIIINFKKIVEILNIDLQ